MLLCSVAFNVNAGDPCGERCTRIQFSYTKVICEFYDGTTNPTAPPIQGPCVFIIIDYSLVTCPGMEPFYEIDDAVFVDNRDYWINLPGGPYTSSYTCNTPLSLTPEEIRTHILDATGAFATVLGSDGLARVRFASACHAQYTYEWPNGAYIKTTISETPGGPPTTIIDTIQLSQSTTYGYNSCDSKGCCTAVVKYVVVLYDQDGNPATTNGQTLYKAITVRTEGDARCESDVVNNPITPTATMIDPITGDLITVTPTITFKGNCTPSCIKDNSSSFGTFTTDVTELKNPTKLELSANPTLFSSHIKFTTNLKIESIVVFDHLGKKVLSNSTITNNELNTSELKVGVYYIQVYLENNITKTIKVEKL